MYNAALLMNEMILFGYAYMPVNVKKIQPKSIGQLHVTHSGGGSPFNK